MRAVRATEAGMVEVGDIAEPAGGEGYTIAVQQVGICGTDIKIVAGKIPVEFPRILGHEIVGNIVAAPAGGHFPTGTRVLVDPAVSCGFCDLCRAGRQYLCRNGGLLGRDVDGVFTEYIVVSEDKIVVVPDSISKKESGVLQVLGTCVHAMKTVSMSPGKVAAVIGLGVSGQLIAQLLTLKGLTVVGITRSEWKRDVASSAGIGHVTAPADAAGMLEEITSGRGPDLVVEAVGLEQTLSEAIELVTIGGQIVVFGTLTSGGKGLPYYHLYHKELTVYNPRAATIGDYADGVVLAASGALALEPIVTHELGLEDAKHAFELVNDSSSMKVLMTVSR